MTSHYTTTTATAAPSIGMDENSLQELLQYLNSAAQQDPTKRLQLIQKGKSIAKFLGDTQAQYQLANRHAELCLEQGATAQATDCYMEALRIAQTLTQESAIVESLQNMGSVYKTKAEYSKAFDYFNQVLSYNKKLYQAQAYLNIADLRQVEGKHVKALDYTQKALWAAEAIEDAAMIANVHTTMGDIFQKQDSPQKAIDAYTRGLKMIDKQLDFDLQKGVFLQKIANTQLTLENEDLAIHFYKKALDILNEEAYSYEAMTCRMEIAALFQTQDNKEQATIYFEQALQICKAHNYQAEKITCLENLQQCYMATGDREQVMECLQALVQAQKDYYTNIAAPKHLATIAHKSNEIQSLIAKNETLTAQNKQLSQNNEAITAQHQTLVTQLQEPLNNIRTFTKLIHKNPTNDLDESSKEYLEIISKNSQQITDKLTALSTFATLKKNATKEQKIDLAQEIIDILDPFKPQLKALDAKVKFKRLPEIIAEPQHIRQLFQQLIANSIHFCDKKKELEIRITYEEIDNKYRFAIEDNGIGIAESKQKQIFDLFHQANPTSNDNTGAGLAICKKITELNNQKIWLESTVAEGTTVYFTWDISISN